MLPFCCEINLISGQGFAPYLNLLLRSDKVRHTATYRNIFFMCRILPLSNKSCTRKDTFQLWCSYVRLDPDHSHADQFKIYTQSSQNCFQPGLDNLASILLFYKYGIGI
jgi:hypothetical protein